ncbi:MAG TPA: glycosyltransferase [Ktedonobacteraceae bacterium]|jgi:hypothetical protein
MIPNTIHFLYLGGKPFSLVHYLAIKSAHVINRPERICFHYSQQPTGQWWEKARPLLQAIPLIAPTTVAGVPLCVREHQADVARLQILYEYGGIYLDIDVICVKPLTPLLASACVLGEQGVDGGRGLCNAVILAEKGAWFIQKWLEGFDARTSLWSGFRSNGYDSYRDELSVRYPRALAQLFPEYISVQGSTRFYWPLYSPEQLAAFFKERGPSCEEAYCHHLWESLSWRPYLQDLTVQQIHTADTTFTRIVSAFL